MGLTGWTNQKYIGIAIASALLAYGCSGARSRPSTNGEGAVRLLASTEDDLKAGFERLLDSSDPGREFGDYFDRQVSLYLRGQALLARFDEDLDRALSESRAGKPVAALDSDAYPRLLALRLIGQRERERVVYIYRNLLELARDQNADKQQAASRILGELNRTLRSRMDQSREVIQAAGLMDIARDLMAVKRLGHVFSGIELKKFLGAEHQIMSWVSGHRKELQAAARDADAQGTDEIAQAVDEAAPKIQMELRKSQIERSPQSTTGPPCPDGLRLCPTSGKNGNVTGLSWPAGMWALTFDDGPSATLTPKAIQNLKDPEYGNGMKATFFMLAENASRLGSTVKLVQEAGMPVENHSFTHADLTKASQAKLEHEIFDSTDVETRIFGEAPQFFRCPYGAGMNVQHIREMIAQRKMIHVFWNVDTLDWQDKNPESIVARAKKEMALEKHGVILFHDVHPQSIEASKILMKYLRTTPGIRTVTIPEFADIYNGIHP